jgi:hypothetical protein
MNFELGNRRRQGYSIFNPRLCLTVAVEQVLSAMFRGEILRGEWCEAFEHKQCAEHRYWPYEAGELRPN